MKGALHTDELMHAVVDADQGLHTARRISHVFVIDAPGYPRPLLVTDAAINAYPTLDDKRTLCKTLSISPMRSASRRRKSRS